LKSARKEKKRKTIQKRKKKKDWMNVELENMQLLWQQHECRKFYKEINIARKQFKSRVNICRNEDAS